MHHLSAPRVGAIIRGRFPEQEDVFDDHRGKCRRPLLVLAIERQGDGATEVLVAYGTSQHINRCGRGEFVLTTEQAPFLNTATKFCLCRRLWLPLSTRHFPMGSSAGRCDVLGALPRNVLARVEQAATEAGLI